MVLMQPEKSCNTPPLHFQAALIASQTQTQPENPKSLCIMSYLIPKSLLSRLTLLVTTWLISAFVAIGISMMLSWRLEGGAAAVNDTGGLRYQTYRLRLYLKDTA